MIQHLRVGIPLVGGSVWMGGVSYIELLVRAVRSLPDNARPRLFLIIRDKQTESLSYYQSFIKEFDGILYVADQPLPAHILTWALEVCCCKNEDELFDHLDLYFPAVFDAIPGRKAVSWIPDFQHRILPEMFTPHERSMRDEQLDKISRFARIVVVSSETTRQQFYRYFPNSDATTYALPFYSYPQAEWYEPNPLTVQEKYNLPGEFILCCNQFWLHKNHHRLFAAIAILRSRGQHVQLVCTGSTSDYRSAEYFSLLRRYVAKLGIERQVHILGYIPRNDQLQLIRRSLCIVQPSLAEGWSTVVEDSRVFGKDILLSDIEVNLEQQPRYAHYFRQTDANHLADILAELLPSLRPGPNLAREQEAWEEAQQNVKKYADRFCHIVSQAVQVFEQLETTNYKPSSHYEPKAADTLNLPDILAALNRTTLCESIDAYKLISKYLLPPARILHYQCRSGSLVNLLRLAGYDAEGVENHVWHREIASIAFQLTVAEKPNVDKAPYQAICTEIQSSLAEWPGEELVAMLDKNGLLHIKIPENILDQLREKLSKLSLTELEAVRGCSDNIVIVATSGDREMFTTAELPVLSAAIDRTVGQALTIACDLQHFLKEKMDALTVTESRLQFTETDSAARLEIIDRLGKQLAESEADRAARLELIQKLDSQLRDSLVRITNLEQQVNAIRNHKLIKLLRIFPSVKRLF